MKYIHCVCYHGRINNKLDLFADKQLIDYHFAAYIEHQILVRSQPRMFGADNRLASQASMQIN